tara:strand:+ start:126 stop:377 length:252 start_codon:yes stop_codon:yes gene_type:complete
MAKYYKGVLVQELDDGPMPKTKGVIHIKGKGGPLPSSRPAGKRLATGSGGKQWETPKQVAKKRLDAKRNAIKNRKKKGNRSSK